jgi:hypothetical protein
VIQFTAPGGDLTFEVGANRICGDGDGEGFDLIIFRACVIGGFAGAPICTLYDFNRDGETSAQDYPGFASHVTPPGGTASGPYVLEVLSRN